MPVTHLSRSQAYEAGVCAQVRQAVREFSEESRVHNAAGIQVFVVFFAKDLAQGEGLQTCQRFGIETRRLEHLE